MFEVSSATRAGSGGIATAIVADRETTREALRTFVEDGAGLAVVGSADSLEDGLRLLELPHLQVILVNLPLSHPADAPPGIAFIQRAKARRPDVGILSLKRDVDEHRLRAALDAGADGCCMAATSHDRLVQAVKAVVAGATWLDPEISAILLRDQHTVRRHRPKPHLSPREREILRLLTDGYTNEEIAERLKCATATVKTHLVHLFKKLGVHDRVCAAVAALRLDLL